MLYLHSNPKPPLSTWSWWTKISLTCTKYDIMSPLQILMSKDTKHQLKSMFKKKITAYWFEYFCSQCPSYSSLKFFNISNLKPNKPHPIIINSGTSEFLNHKPSIMLKMLCGHYRLNSLKHKFNTNTSPLCQMYTMRTIIEFIIFRAILFTLLLHFST